MKKYVAIVLGVLFVLSFAVTAFAQDKPEITLGGELRVRGWYLDNSTSTYLPSPTESQAWYDQRVRLNINADVTKNTTAFVQLETGTATSDVWTWGNLNSKPTSITFREAWILHKGSGLLGIPALVKIGHMPLALGEKQFLDHTKFGDDAIVFLMDPTKELTIGLLTAKFVETTTSIHRDDIDGYVLLATYKLNKDNTVGLNYTLVKSDQATPVTVADLDSLSFQNLGLHANGKAAGLAYAAEVDFQFGKIDRTTTDRKFGGYGIFAKLGYKVDPVNLRASFAMGSGDNDSTDDKNKEFQTTMGRDIHYSFIYEFTVRTAAAAVAGNGSQGQVLTNLTRNTGIANTTYYNLGVDYSPVKDLTLALDGFIIRATKALTAGQSKNVGSEVDLRASYKIDKNLTYSIIAGSFSPGKFYTTGASPFNLAKKKTVTQAMHALTLSF